MMTLGNMRDNGVRSLSISCGALWCHRQAVLDVSAFADDVVVPSFGRRMVCTACGAIGACAAELERARADQLVRTAHLLKGSGWHRVKFHKEFGI